MGRRLARWFGHEGSQSLGGDPLRRRGDPIPRMEMEGVRGGGDEDGGGHPSPRREGEDRDDGGLEEQRKDDLRRKRPGCPRRDLVGDLDREWKPS